MSNPRPLGMVVVAGLAAAAVTGLAGAQPKPEFKPFAEVAKDYEEVVSTADGAKPLYGLYIDKKRNQLLAELPPGWARQKHLIAATQASGAIFAGLQGPSRYVYWKRYDTRMALVEPELATRSNGEAESKSSVDRLFTDRVLFDVPIVCIGPKGQPVVDLDDILINKAGVMLGGGGGRMGGSGPLGANTRLATIAKAKAFPENIEVAIEVPVAGGRLATFHYSISNLKANPRYKPREADERVGYFTTVYRDLGQYDVQKKWVRYIDRWHLEKRDPKLKLSPPKEPITFYVEHTVPVRYRRYVKQGIEHWNEAFEAIGIDGALQVAYQDKSTGANMDKDPEDVRYNFIRWLNNDISTAIGPHRAHPLTGQILDADVVLTDGWIRAYWGWYNEQAPELAAEGMSAETLRWLEDYPEWDPRLLLATPDQRERVLALRVERTRRLAAGEPTDDLPDAVDLMLTPEHAEIEQWVGHDHHCMAAHGLAFDMSFARLALEMEGLVEMTPDMKDAEMLDGVPEWFVGPLLAELVCHEVGHTLGLRHNFKSSSIYTLEEINSADHKGNKTIGGSVMDYLPPNFNMDAGETQGDFAMIGIGPYDRWAIEYGYTFEDPAKVLERCAEPELVYLTDDDTGGPDPLARRYDFSADPLDYAANQMRIVEYHRGRILDDFVKDGQSWSNARRGYQSTLNMQTRMLSMMAGWVGGAHVNRDRKGDPNGRVPIEVVDPEKQRRALAWIIDHSFEDESFGLTPELLAHMTVDKWSDASPGDRTDPTWPVHDRVFGVQASALTMIMNPSTMKRVYDNEYRTPSDDDALTVAEVLQTLYDSVYGELATDLNGATFTDREPMISSLRQNLQGAMTDRLVAFAVNARGLPRPVKTLATQHLRRLGESVDDLLDEDDEQLDPYTRAHLEDIQERVTRALERIYVENG